MLRETNCSRIRTTRRGLSTSSEDCCNGTPGTTLLRVLEDTEREYPVPDRIRGYPRLRSGSSQTSKVGRHWLRHRQTENNYRRYRPSKDGLPGPVASGC